MVAMAPMTSFSRTCAAAATGRIDDIDPASASRLVLPSASVAISAFIAVVTSPADILYAFIAVVTASVVVWRSAAPTLAPIAEVSKTFSASAPW
jgi:hypothetical protein